MNVLLHKSREVYIMRETYIQMTKIAICKTKPTWQNDVNRRWQIERLFKWLKQTCLSKPCNWEFQGWYILSW